VHPALLGVGAVELAHGPRDADVAEPPFLLEAVHVGDRALVRKQAVFHAAQEDDRKLEALGGVQCHHLHAVLPFLGLAFARFEHGMREERHERRKVAILGFEPAGRAHELLEVLESRLALVGFSF
jgi:hypothetical protein